MTGRTHDLAAFTALNFIVTTQIVPAMSFSTAIIAVSACLLGGLTPDIDNKTSDFWDKLPAGNFFSGLIQPFIGKHRKISHSFLGVIFFGLLSKYLLILASQTLIVNMDIVWISFMIGFVSHLLMDALTTEGVPLLFPLPFNFGFPPIRVLRIVTGRKREKYLVFPLLIIINAYLFYSYYSIYLKLVKSMIK